jgi:chromosome segregation ATPase
MQAVTKLEKSFNQALAKLVAGADNDEIASDNAKLSKRISHLVTVKASKDEEITALQDDIASASKREQAAVKQVDEFKKAQTEAQKQITALQAAVKDATTTKDDALKQVDTLKSQVKNASAGQKDQVVNAQGVNTTMQAELEALRAQRETDLAEVNDILNKLTPLVEGK